MDEAQATALFEEFTLRCVQPSFARKFHESFGRKPITPRFFRKFTSVQKHVLLSDPSLLGACDSVTVRVMWPVGGSLFGALLQGAPTRIDQVFVEEGDAIAWIGSGEREFYLFLSGTTDDLYKIEFH